MSDSNHPDEVGLLLYIRDREEYIWQPDDPLGHLLISLYPTLMGNGQVHHSMA